MIAQTQGRELLLVGTLLLQGGVECCADLVKRKAILALSC